MGGFATGLIGQVGKTIQAHNERNVAYQHQANEEMAQQYDKMAQEAAAGENDALAADLNKASFSIRSTMPGAKPKKITDQNGATWDPLDMQGIIKKHAMLAMQRKANAPAPSQPIAPNGATPQMTPPPSMDSSMGDKLNSSFRFDSTANQ